jgi:polyphenol oxidase
VSAQGWAELNLALHVEDEVRRVLANRDLVRRRLGASALVWPQQVHGSKVLVVDAAKARTSRIQHGGAHEVDALVTTVPGVALGVLVADCLPVLLTDPVHSVVGAAHAGRRGLAAGVLTATLDAMVASGAEVSEVTAVIGPAVCGRCYEVPAEMREEVGTLVPGSAAVTLRGTPALDLPAGAEAMLLAAGVAAVRRTGICTVEDSRFYSYRRDHQTGRFAGVVVINSEE